MVTVGQGAGQPAGRIPARTMLLLGVDPGQHGAAALVEWPSRRLVWWSAWTTLRREGVPDVIRLQMRCACRTTGCGCPTESEEPNQHGVGEAIWYVVANVYCAPGQPIILSVEGLFSIGQSCIPLAESCGELMGPLRSLTTQPIRRPQSREWRPRILGIPARTRKGPAEAAAIRWAEGLGLLGEEHKALTKAERGAVAEACAIALWGAL